MGALSAAFLTPLPGAAWAATPPVAVPGFKGEVLLAKGVVQVDTDLGTGYACRPLIESAKLSKQAGKKRGTR